MDKEELIDNIVSEVSEFLICEFPDIDELNNLDIRLLSRSIEMSLLEYNGLQSVEPLKYVSVGEYLDKLSKEMN